MKKLISALLQIVVLVRVLPLGALATVSRVMPEEELNRAYARFTRTEGFENVQTVYLEAEQLRYYKDQLTEASGVISEYCRRLREEDKLFDSDRI
jgi:hypothetical protein